MGIYIKQTDGLQRLSGEKLTYQKIVSALGYVPFKGNYNDLTNKPITQDGNDNSFIIQDSSGNKIAQIDESGLVVTNVKAYNIYSNGVNLLEALNNLANDTTKIDQLQAQIDALPFNDYTNSDYLNICDKDNNPIARFDENGFTTTEILTNAINIKHKYTDGEGNVVTEDYDVGAEIKTLKKGMANTPDDVVTEPELAAALAKIPVTEQGNITSTSGEFAIQDESGNKIMQVDANGLTVPQIKTTSANIGGVDVPNGLAPKEHTHQLTNLEGAAASPSKTYFILASKGDQAKPEWIEEDHFATASELQGVGDKVTTLIGEDTDKSVRTIANETLAEALIPEDAQESLNTLEEIAA